MIKIIHRVNTIDFLQKIPKKYGVEVDVRAYENNLILNHEPFESGELLNKYLKNYNHAFIIFNIKEAGIEKKVIDLAKKFNIKKYFLLDVEIPFLYKASKNGFSKIAIRFSEIESIENVLIFKNQIDWVWIDTFTKLPLNKNVINKLSEFKTCLVCPERWDRPNDISFYNEKLKNLNFKPDAVMTSLNFAKDWK